MKTFKNWRLAFTMLAAIVLASCSDKDGDWERMFWRADTPVVKTGDGCFDISPDGGTFVFFCLNYSHPWFEGAVENGEHCYPLYIDNPEYPTLQGAYFEAAIYRNKLMITFEPNTSSAVRNTSVTVTAGDIFYTFHFKQFSNRRQ